VAVKRLQHVEPKEKKHNINEMSFLAFCKHPNIVTYYTSLLVKNELMVTSLCPRASLSLCVFGHSSHCAIVDRDGAHGRRYAYGSDQRPQLH
jgi:serine/threonine protein kinase